MFIFSLYAQRKYATLRWEYAGSTTFAHVPIRLFIAGKRGLISEALAASMAQAKNRNRV